MRLKATLSVAPRTFSMFREDRHRVVFCFEDGEGFCRRFDDERLPGSPR